jgi:hypothetical protein
LNKIGGFIQEERGNKVFSLQWGTYSSWSWAFNQSLDTTDTCNNTLIKLGFHGKLDDHFPLEKLKHSKFSSKVAHVARIVKAFDG